MFNTASVWVRQVSKTNLCSVLNVLFVKCANAQTDITQTRLPFCVLNQKRKNRTEQNRTFRFVVFPVLLNNKNQSKPSENNGSLWVRRIFFANSKTRTAEYFCFKPKTKKEPTNRAVAIVIWIHKKKQIHPHLNIVRPPNSVFFAPSWLEWMSEWMNGWEWVKQKRERSATRPEVGVDRQSKSLELHLSLVNAVRVSTARVTFWNILCVVPCNKKNMFYSNIFKPKSEPVSVCWCGDVAPSTDIWFCFRCHFIYVSFIHSSVLNPERIWGHSRKLMTFTLDHLSWIVCSLVKIIFA